jgi:uncharacterized phage protein (TIGR01671 family)
MNTDRLLTRVWDTSLKKMMYLGENYLGLSSEGIYFFDQTFEPFDKIYIPMRCTGLKDKNSKLIYESDILQEDNYVQKYSDENTPTPEEILAVISPHSEPIEYKGDEAICHFSPVFVLWNGDYLDVKADNSDSFRGKIPTNSEIIGNIYQNPELLKDIPAKIGKITEKITKFNELVKQTKEESK